MNRTNLKVEKTKWALTMSLLIALGFCLPTGQKAAGSLEAASKKPAATSDDSDRLEMQDTIDGHKVTYIENGGKTIAKVSQALEGTGNCEDCTRDIPLDISIKDSTKSVKDLDIALLSYLRGHHGTTTAAKDDDATDNQDQSAKDAKLESDRKALDRLRKSCNLDDKSQDDSRSSRLASSNMTANSNARCLVEGFITLLKERQGDRKIDAEVAEEFFRTDVQDVLMGLINADSSTAQNTLFGGPSNQFGLQSPVGFNTVSGQPAYLKVAEYLRRIDAQLPSKYNAIRGEAKDLAEGAIRSYAQKAAQDKAQAQQLSKQVATLEAAAQAATKTNPNAAVIYSQMASSLMTKQTNLTWAANEEYVQLQNAIPAFASNMQSGLQDAVNGNLIQTSAAQLLLNGFQDDSNNIVLQLLGAGAGLTTVPGIATLPGTTIPATKPSLPYDGYEFFT